MDEASLQQLHTHLSAADLGDGVALREIQWAELIARLAASREIRGAMPHPVAANGGSSFGALAGAPSNAPRVVAEPGKRDVNPDALGNGKRVVATTGNAMPVAAGTTRGKQ